MKWTQNGKNIQLIVWLVHKQVNFNIGLQPKINIRLADQVIIAFHSQTHLLLETNHTVCVSFFHWKRISQAFVLREIVGRSISTDYFSYITDVETNSTKPNSDMKIENESLLGNPTTERKFHTTSRKLNQKIKNKKAKKNLGSHKNCSTHKVDTKWCAVLHMHLSCYRPVTTIQEAGSARANEFSVVVHSILPFWWEAT